jgi:hypothetical protein
MHYEVLLLWGVPSAQVNSAVPTQGCHSPSSSVPVCNYYVITYVRGIQTTEEQIVAIYNDGTTGESENKFPGSNLAVINRLFVIYSRMFTPRVMNYLPSLSPRRLPCGMIYVIPCRWESVSCSLSHLENFDVFAAVEIIPCYLALFNYVVL